MPSKHLKVHTHTGLAKKVIQETHTHTSHAKQDIEGTHTHISLA